MTAIIGATLAANLGLIALDIITPATASAGAPASHAETLPVPA